MTAWACRTVPPAPDRRNSFIREFAWTYAGTEYAWALSLPRPYFRAHRRRHRQYTYGSYVADTFTQHVVAGLCRPIERKANKRGFSRAELIRFASAFVQHLPYTPDDVSTDFSNYPRYPIETLVDETGDCEDSSLLLAAILHGLGYEVGLLEFPTHLAVGVVEADLPTNLTFDGVGYTYIEATGTGWAPGRVPPKYRNVDATLHRVETAPAVYCCWHAVAEDGHISSAGTVTNFGAGTAQKVRMRLRFSPSGGIGGDEVVERVEQLQPGEDHQWTEPIDPGDAGQYVPEWQVSIGIDVHDRGTGDPQRIDD